MKTLLYRCPGKHQRPGGTFEYIGVTSQEKSGELLDSGWFETLPEAIAGKANEKPIDETSPPTRKELKVQAEALGLNFDSKTSSDKLSKMIEEALAK